MRNCWAKIIPSLWFKALWRGAILGCALLLSHATPAAQAPQKGAAKSPARKKAATKPAAAAPSNVVNLATLVRTYRSSATSARRAAVESWAISHPGDAAAARLALGVVALEQKDYATAMADLRKALPKLPRIADYAAYYLASAEVESQNLETVAKNLETVRAAVPASPLAGRAWLLDARARKASAPAAAVKTLRDNYAALPQPEGDVTLADCYQAANDLSHAAEFYQRVYYQYLTGDAATRSAAALLAIEDTMGASYPQPLPQQKLHRADRLLETGKYDLARAEYQSLLDRVPALERDQALVRIGAADYKSGHASQAYSYLSGLTATTPEADAERLYYLEECARHMGEDDRMIAAVKTLAEKYPKSPWRLKALTWVASHYLVINAPEDYLPLYQAVYQNFPNDPAAGLSHWKVTFQAYLRGKNDAAELLREHLRTYPLHATTGAALYFLGRLSERNKDYAAAKACYRQVAQGFENYYYGGAARQRLAAPEMQSSGTSARMAEFLGGVPLPRATPVPAESTAVTNARIERSRLLRAAGLNDLADGELRFGARTDGQPALLALEMAAEADAPHQGLRLMKTMAPEYLNLKLEQAPRRFWELLYPLPYRAELTADAEQRGLDPFLVAGLIRQESEFDPAARSQAAAYGLAQVRPATGRLYARRAGVVQFGASMLFEPATNLKIGTAILRSMLDQNSGSLEQTLAAYNAGPNRVAEWLTWSNYREPAEFVESIPFTETREYVQAVLRNADMYRRIYH